MPLYVEGIVDCGVRLQESLSGSPTLEALHLSLASSNDEMRIFSAIVVAQSPAMVTVTETELMKRGTVGTKSIGDDPLRFDVLILQQPSQQSNGSAGVAAFLHDHIHHLAFIINSAPDPHALASDHRDELIKMPAW